MLKRRNTLHSKKHTKLIKIAIISALIILSAVLIAYGWQKYEEEKYPEGTEKNYRLPDAITGFFRMMSDFSKINENNSEEEPLDSSEPKEEKIIEIVVGGDDPEENPGQPVAEQEEPRIIGGIVPENKVPADTSEFDNVLFVGDHFVYGIEGNYFANSSFAYTTDLDMNTMLTKKAIKKDGVTMTLTDYVASFENISYVYVLLSAENVSWMDCPTFVKKYTTFIDEIIKVQPQAEIYVQPLLPINEPMAQKRSYSVTNKKIEQINSYITEIAAEKKLWYLDMYSCFVDNDGSLPAEYTTNGIRFTPEAYEIWYDFILKHRA